MRFQLLLALPLPWFGWRELPGVENGKGSNSDLWSHVDGLRICCFPRLLLWDWALAVQ